jgi:hypothetical protein
MCTSSVLPKDLVFTVAASALTSTPTMAPFAVLNMLLLSAILVFVPMAVCPAIAFSGMILQPSSAARGVTCTSNERRRRTCSSASTMLPRPLPTATVPAPACVHQMSSSNDDGDNNGNVEPPVQNPQRRIDNNLGRAIRGFQSSAFKQSIESGDMVVCKREIPSLGIYENTSYELTSIYAQYFDDNTQTVIKTPLQSLDTPIPTGCTRYITLYSPVVQRGDDDGVIVTTPEDVGLVNVRSELINAVYLAIPGFFWVFVASSFYNIYHERTGGSFMDAFWGR